jgi:DNA-binding XRE family transcriptional regulator
MKELRVQLKVKEVEVVHDCKVFCDIEENRIWLKEDAELIDLSVELARSFGLPLEHVFHLNWALGQTDLHRISDDFERFGIPIIELPKEKEIYKPKLICREEFVEKPPSVRPEEIVELSQKPVEAETQEVVAEPSATEVLEEDLTTQETIEEWTPECRPEQAEQGSSEEYTERNWAPACNKRGYERDTYFT